MSATPADLTRVSGGARAEVSKDAGPEPEFAVLGARMLPYAAAPTLVLDLHVSEPSGRQIYMIALSVQLMLDPARRVYDAGTRERLEGLFGPPERWAVTTRSVLWSQLDVVVPCFTSSTIVPLPLVCNFDMEVAAAKYLHALPDGEAPLALHFNGMVYYPNEQGGLQIVLIPWSRSVDFRLPVSVWRETVEHYYPNTGWVALRTETMRALEHERVRLGLPTYDSCLTRMLEPGDGR